MSMLERLKKASTIKDTAILNKSKFLNDPSFTPTSVLGMNIALSGEIRGGLKRGITLICGLSRHFKSLFMLIMAEAYMKQYPDAVCLFYDSEFGTPMTYFESVGIDPERVLHTPVTNIEELKFDLMQQLAAINRGDKVIILIDSIGNLASKKEVDDANDQKSVADMTRAKALKSLFRMITPILTLKNIPMLGVNHIYMEQSLYPKAIVGGGQGPFLAADNIWIITRSQEKDGTELLGYNFKINIEKSRWVREKTVIPITVKFDGGISIYSGLLDIALESKHVIKPSNGWYSRVNMDTGEVEEKKWRMKDTDSEAFWKQILAQQSFHEFVSSNYKITTSKLISDEELDSAVGDIMDEDEDVE